jgi:peptidoglycan hydrolase-like amidase
VESLYGATQAIVDKAHKGVGMSQTRAYANQGYDYRQILGTYYPGVEIARVEARG